MLMIIQLACLIALACVSALVGFGTSRFICRCLHEPEDFVEFFSGFGAGVTGVCCLAMCLIVNVPYSILSLLEVGLISQLGALICLVVAAIAARLVRLSCNLVDRLFSKKFALSSANHGRTKLKKA
jgi:hypothetical protein